jgi:hypothetical protein
MSAFNRIFSPLQNSHTYRLLVLPSPAVRPSVAGVLVGNNPLLCRQNAATVMPTAYLALFVLAINRNSRLQAFWLRLHLSSSSSAMRRASATSAVKAPKLW